MEGPPLVVIDTQSVRAAAGVPKTTTGLGADKRTPGRKRGPGIDLTTGGHRRPGPPPRAWGGESPEAGDGDGEDEHAAASVRAYAADQHAKAVVLASGGRPLRPGQRSRLAQGEVGAPVRGDPQGPVLQGQAPRPAPADRNRTFPAQRGDRLAEPPRARPGEGGCPTCLPVAASSSRSPSGPSPRTFGVLYRPRVLARACRRVVADMMFPLSGQSPEGGFVRAAASRCPEDEE